MMNVPIAMRIATMTGNFLLRVTLAAQLERVMLESGLYN